MTLPSYNSQLFQSRNNSSISTIVGKVGREEVKLDQQLEL